MHGRRLDGHGDEGGGELSRSEHREGRLGGGKNSASHSRPDGVEKGGEGMGAREQVLGRRCAMSVVLNVKRGDRREVLNLSRGDRRTLQESRRVGLKFTRAARDWRRVIKLQEWKGEYLTMILGRL